MVARWLVAGAGIFLACGCGQEKSTPTPVETVPAVRSTSSTISEEDVAAFLRIVARSPGGKVPEFSGDSDDDVDFTLSGPSLAAAFRGRFRALFDPLRQGTIWKRDRDLNDAIIAEGWTPEDFAVLLRSLSCALMCDRLAGQHDLASLSRQCDAQINELITRIDHADRFASQDGAEATFQRTQAAVRLGRMVALQEFVELLHQVPPENLAIVRRYRTELAVLTPQDGAADPLGDPFAAADFSETVNR